MLAFDGEELAVSTDISRSRAYYYEDFRIGMEFTTARRKISNDDILVFARLTGDDNPIHTDPDFARRTQFGRPIAHGLLVQSIGVGLIAELGIVTGTALALVEMRGDFREPVYAGDEVLARVKVTQKRETSSPERGVVWRSVDVINQASSIVQSFEMISLILRKTRSR